MKDFGAFCLKPGTILDNRYQIHRVIGIGGFGITYEAVNERLNLRVAIKEFFCREIVYRDAAVSQQVMLTENEAEPHYRAAQKKFLKEARMVGDFASCPGIVDVIDYFEENGTAYMVMGYLDGVTLAQYMKEHGTFQVQPLICKFLPLIETLGKIHECGIIHRDISPDNIMMLRDGSIKLIDFGAAKDYMLQTKTMSVTLKAGYAPCEQYGEGQQGPWTDVYALCATMYECVTGQRPVSSVVRVLNDELKSPSELGIQVDPAFQKILKKGMQIKAEDRYQTMNELKTVLEACLPKPIVPKKRKVVTAVTAIAACAVTALVLGGIVYYREHKEDFLFRGVETETVILVPDENMTAKEYAEAIETIDKRAAVWIGDEDYICKDEDGKIQIEFPLSIIEYDEEDAILDSYSGEIYNKVEQFIAMPLQGAIGIEVEVNGWLDGGSYITLDREQIESLTIKEGQIPQEHTVDFSDYEEYLEIKVSQELAEEIEKNVGDYIESRDYNPEDAVEIEMRYFTDPNTTYMKRYGLVRGDEWNTYYMAVSDNEVWKTLYEYPEISQPFEIYLEIPVEWEEDSVYKGAMQCKESEIADDAVYLEYRYTLWEQLKDEALMTEFTIRFKECMDVFGIPYALGFAPDQGIVIKVAQKDYNSFLGELFVSSKLNLELKDGVNTIDIYEFEVNIIENTDGTFGISLETDYDALKEEWELATEQMLKEGKNSLYLQIETYPIAKAVINEPVTDGKVLFDICMLGEAETFTEEHKPFLDVLLAMAADPRFAISDKPYLRRIQYSSEKKKVEIEPKLENEFLFPRDDVYREVREWLNAEYPDAEIYLEYNNTYGLGKSLRFAMHMDVEKEYISASLNLVQEIYQKFELQDSDFYSIVFYLDDFEEYPSLTFIRNYEDGKFGNYEFHYSLPKTEDTEELLELISENAFYLEYFDDDYQFVNVLG